MKFLRAGALSVLVLVGVAGVAIAGPGDAPNTDEIVTKLTTHLGVEASVAARIAETVQRAHLDGEDIRQSMHTEVQALKAALSTGDEAEMARALTEMRAIQADAQALKDLTQDQVLAEMTVEQQAKWTMHHMHKRHKMEQAMKLLSGD